MGINTQQNDYYEGLFRRTTASYRAKLEKDNDKRGGLNKGKSFGTKPSSSTYATGANRKAFSERNHTETSTSSNDLLNSIQSTTSQAGKKVEDAKHESKTLKALVENTMTQILNDKYSQEFIDKVNNNTGKEKSSIRSVVEQILKQKLSNLRHSSNEILLNSPQSAGSLKSIIENIVTQVLNEKLSSLQKENAKAEDHVGLVNLSQNMQQKLIVSENPTTTLPRESVGHYNSSNKPLDSQSLVQQLLNFEGVDSKNVQSKNHKSDKENSTIPATTDRIKRLQRSARKKPEWQDPNPQDKILNQAQKTTRAQSPAVSSSVHSARSKGSVLIRHSKSQGRKPNSDPVALYQYYKKEWEHFRKQIPGESPHSRLRWHVRQRLLDPE